MQETNKKEGIIINRMYAGDYLNRQGIKEVVEKDPNFNAFRNVIHRHTHTNPNGYLYYEMMEKLYSRIETYKKT